MQNLMFWHITKAFKEAVKHRHLLLLEYFVDDLGIDIKHDSFRDLFHMFLFSCMYAERQGHEDHVEINQQVCRFLAASAG